MEEDCAPAVVSAGPSATAFAGIRYRRQRCHCADCRKESGSAFSVYGNWPIEAFGSSGEIASYDGRGFCPRCGSRLLNPPDPGDTLIEIRIGSLDEAPFELKPKHEIWVKRRESWILPLEDVAQYDES